MGLTPMPHGGDVPGIDADSERGRAFFLIAAVVAFVISAWQTVNEIRYAVRGKTATATVARVNPVSEPSRGRPKEYLRVEVDFSDAGQPRHSLLRRPLTTPIKVGQQVEVEYLPESTDHVRVHGDRSTFWLLVFVGSSGWMIWSIVRLAADSRRMAGSRGRRGRRSPA